MIILFINNDIIAQEPNFPQTQSHSALHQGCSHLCCHYIQPMSTDLCPTVREEAAARSLRFPFSQPDVRPVILVMTDMLIISCHPSFIPLKQLIILTLIVARQILKVIHWNHAYTFRHSMLQWWSSMMSVSIILSLW